MIVSHTHRFIFLKTVKTAGTSLEIALSKYCGADDIITPITPEDEALRRELGYRGPQNYAIPLKHYDFGEMASALLHRRRLRFQNHDPAGFVRKHLDAWVWESYFKFAFERNPWDKVISFYYWRQRKEPEATLSEYIQSGKCDSIRGFEIYAIDGEAAVDRVFKYEEMASALEELREILCLPEIPSMPRAKSGFRKDTRPYREVFSDADRDRIAKAYAHEIAHFNYAY